MQLISKANSISIAGQDKASGLALPPKKRKHKSENNYAWHVFALFFSQVCFFIIIFATNLNSV